MPRRVEARNKRSRAGTFFRSDNLSSLEEYFEVIDIVWRRLTSLSWLYSPSFVPPAVAMAASTAARVGHKARRLSRSFVVLRHDDGKEDEAVVTGASAARRSANLMSAMGSREQLLEWYQCRHQPSALSLQPRFPHNTRRKGA